MSPAYFDIQVLTECADVAILRTGSSSEPKRMALIALAFCDLFTEKQNESQRRAVQVARQFWTGGDADDYLDCVNKYAEIIDLDQLNHVNRRDAAMNRLVWTALNANGELDGYACEFLINLGEDAGLNANQMALILSENIQGF
jgi:hypothetical protein